MAFLYKQFFGHNSISVTKPSKRLRVCICVRVCVGALKLKFLSDTKLFNTRHRF